MFCHKHWFSITIATCIFLFAACRPSGYFVSPMYGNSTPYHATPMQTDSIKNAWYINTAFSPGYNNNGFDYTYAGQVNAYRAHAFKFFNLYYGSGLTLGDYTANAYFSSIRYNKPDISENTNHFFGSFNLNGGINFVIPFHKVGEWRVLGLHESMQQEFGNYLSFRRGFNPDTVDGVANSSFLNTIGISSELAFNLPRDIKIGGFVQYNILTGADYRDIYFDKNPAASAERYQYVTLGFFMGVNRYNFFMQSNTGQQMFSASFGINYRLGR